jgi:hypothetical protein
VRLLITTVTRTRDPALMVRDATSRFAVTVGVVDDELFDARVVVLRAVCAARLELLHPASASTITRTNAVRFITASMTPAPVRRFPTRSDCPIRERYVERVIGSYALEGERSVLAASAG